MNQAADQVKEAKKENALEVLINHWKGGNATLLYVVFSKPTVRSRSNHRAYRSSTFEKHVMCM